MQYSLSESCSLCVTNPTNHVEKDEVPHHFLYLHTNDIISDVSKTPFLYLDIVFLPVVRLRKGFVFAQPHYIKLPLRLAELLL